MARLARHCIGHLLRHLAAQFVIHQWQGFLSGLGIALFNAVEDAREIADSPSICRAGPSVDSAGV